MKQTIAIIGGGPSALMLAALLEPNNYEVHIYEQNTAVGRKFLVAGDGGFNLTHSEDIKTFVTRYTPKSFLEKALNEFTNLDLCHWLSSIGIKTYVGTSKRIFPEKGIKPIEVLTAILEELKNKNVQIYTKHRWVGWGSDHQLKFLNNNKEVFVKADKIIFALGGASWKVTGSDGAWSTYFAEKGIEIFPFQSSNCAFKIDWENTFIDRAQGKWLKNISVTCNGILKKGELVLTKFGIEGGAIYALSSQIRKQIRERGKAEVFIDLKPSLSYDEIYNAINLKGIKSVSKVLSDVLKLSDTQIQILKSMVTKDDFLNSQKLASSIKKLPLTILDTAPLDEAISTVGGISLEEVDGNFQLFKMKDNYVIGEMLDWDAPTGGYLLQACFSMGAALARILNGK